MQFSERLRPPRLGLAASELSDRQRALLDELEAVFVEEGFSHLTVGELATRLRCSRRTLYELAPSKDELVLVVCDRLLRRVGRIAREELARVGDPAEGIEVFLLGPSGLRPTSGRFNEDVARHPAAARLFAAHYRYATAVLGDVIEAGIERGDFRPVDSRVVAEIADAAVTRFMDADLQRETGLSGRDMTAVLAGLLRAALAPDSPAPSSHRRRRRSA